MPLVLSKDEILKCCACDSFAANLASRGPFESTDTLVNTSRIIWWQETPVVGWLQAFAAHPRIGDVESLRRKFDAFTSFSKGEQAQAAVTASESTLRSLAQWNTKYEAKFGHIFIICAAGKSADFMLEAIISRYANTPQSELINAAIEQQKITEQRLVHVTTTPTPTNQGVSTVMDRRAGQILMHLQHRVEGDGESSTTRSSLPPPPPSIPRSPITTHVLDTSLGRPAPEVRVVLEKRAPGSADAWDLIAKGSTNADGRIPDLLPPSNEVMPGIYRITFDTAEYMGRCKAQHPDFFPDVPFYPSARIEFQIAPHQSSQHFHVPLTWNPYGYSTYRGS